MTFPFPIVDLAVMYNVFYSSPWGRHRFGDIVHFAEDALSHGQPVQRVLAALGHRGARREKMAVSGLADTVVTVPIVSMDLGAFGDRVLDETYQTLARSIGDMAQANTADFPARQFDGDRNQRFADQLAATDTVFLASNVGLVDFHGSRELLAPDPDHGIAQLLQHEPGGLVTAQPQLPLQSLGTQTGLLRAHQPHPQKPTPQGQMALMKDRSCCQRRLVSATRTVIRAAACRPSFVPATGGTGGAVRPPHRSQVGCTRFVGDESLRKLHQVLGELHIHAPSY